MKHILFNIIGMVTYGIALYGAQMDFFNVPQSLTILDILYVFEIIIFGHILFLAFFVKSGRSKMFGILLSILFLILIFSTISKFNPF
jgi:hypothetical protein